MIATKKDAGAALVTAPTALAERPAWLGDARAEGAEHLTKDDLQLPRLALAQALSPQLDPDHASYVDGLKLGDLFNDLTGQIYGRGPLELAIARIDPPRYVEFHPREEGGGVKDLDVPANDPRTQFDKDPETGESRKPIATKFYDFVVVLLPSREVIALSFKSTGLRIARQLNSMIKLRNAPIWAARYAVSSTMTQNAFGKFAVYQIKSAPASGDAKAGWVDEATGAFTRQLFEGLKGKTLVIEREPGMDDAEDMPTDGAAGEM